ncbi:SEC-C metal-binding domain-containing protein [Clostridium sediminicola]|uniref:SEC-C metal-binding domain-containing protein n=1 Tax=Clostridium sediminicola TaxID=3114879 RepID=UPI0031F26BCA
MSLYNDWTEMVVDYVKTKGEAAFWSKYEEIEKEVYVRVLNDYTEVISGKVGELAERFETPINFFMGFLDGINESLVQKIDVENLELETEITLEIEYENLYFNMLDAKAEYLYNLSQWNGIFSEEKRKEITKAWRASKMVVRDPKVGRNDPCPCGSGKKYKKCCANK